MPKIQVTIPAGRQLIPTAQNQPSRRKCRIVKPAIAMATPERKYDRRVLSFARSVRSIARWSRKVRFSALKFL